MGAVELQLIPAVFPGIAVNFKESYVQTKGTAKAVLFVCDSDPFFLIRCNLDAVAGVNISCIPYVILVLYKNV